MSVVNVLLVYVDEIVIMKYSRYGVLLTTQKFVESNEIIGLIRGNQKSNIYIYIWIFHEQIQKSQIL